jgi:hypothetical protein
MPLARPESQHIAPGLRRPDGALTAPDHYSDVKRRQFADTVTLEVLQEHILEKLRESAVTDKAKRAEAKAARKVPKKAKLTLVGGKNANVP